ncbi:MAG: hypothetical protein BZY80_02935 [SAR202 cluster bacterium Io17-Chloro-G2]|nr:MAG: hypothetical protein BZY80_02935 [SAR202 cluster bacterium Io17-Chloro-G2]
MPAQLPFEGLKVADFSWVGVGPKTAKYLADHGATVVRVESETRVDILRTIGPYKDAEPGPNRSQFFGDWNTSKLGLTLNLKTPEAIDVAKRLIAWADVYVESFTPGTMDELGIGYEAAKALNPSIIMVSTCLMGQYGPASPFAGYGFHASAMAGFHQITGWADLAPDGPWVAYTDTVSPHFLAATTMAAMDHCRRTGQGQHIDASQLEMSLHFLAPQIMDFNLSGRQVSRDGNRHESAAPQGAYPCLGDDQWCAITVETDVQWRGLCQVMGEPGWSGDSGFQSVAGRWQRHDEIDERIAAWTSGKTANEVMAELQAVGVPAGVVQRSSDLAEDPQLKHRGFFRNLDHQEMGNVPYAGDQFKIKGYDNGPRFAAPCLGQHNEMVLKELLGMTDEEVVELVIAGAIT